MELEQGESKKHCSKPTPEKMRGKGPKLMENRLVVNVNFLLLFGIALIVQQTSSVCSFRAKPIASFASSSTLTLLTSLSSFPHQPFFDNHPPARSDSSRAGRQLQVERIVRPSADPQQYFSSVWRRALRQGRRGRLQQAVRGWQPRQLWPADQPAALHVPQPHHHS